MLWGCRHIEATAPDKPELEEDGFGSAQLADASNSGVIDDDKPGGLRDYFKPRPERASPTALLTFSGGWYLDLDRAVEVQEATRTNEDPSVGNRIFLD